MSPIRHRNFRQRYPAASNKGLRSREHWPITRRSFWQTSPQATSIHKPAPQFLRCSEDWQLRAKQLSSLLTSGISADFHIGPFSWRTARLLHEKRDDRHDGLLEEGPPRPVSGRRPHDSGY